jgi:hypothetical protein
MIVPRRPQAVFGGRKDLAGNSVAGSAALSRLVSAPASAVAFLGKQPQSVKSVDPKRLEALRHLLESASLSSETVRQIRAVEAIGNPATRRLLDRLAAGSPATHLTQEAKASSGRLARRATPVP